jgi:hypothetical protein
MEAVHGSLVMVEAARNLVYGLAWVWAICLVLFLVVMWYDLNVYEGTGNDGD